MAGKTIWTATTLVALAATAGFGQDAMLEEMYGRGVHAFFSGNQTEAFNSLNAAIKSGSRDPRAFYYRGLILNRFGRPTEAADDFKKGAELEMLGGEPYPVGRSLERIQGAERVNLEKHRRDARLAIHNKQSAEEKARYEQIKESENRVLRSGGATNLAPPVPAGRPDATDPFAAPAAPAPLPAPKGPAAPMPAPPAAADPFAPAAEAPLPAEAPARPAATPKPATPPADDPFAEAPATPAPPAPARPTPPPPAPNPPADDPFAEAPATPAPAPSTPAPAPPAPAPAPPTPAPAPPAADPFAEPATPTTPAPATPPAPTPAPPAADPFAEPPANPAPPTPAPATP